ncbi:hypothetical protein [Bradyrhizobium sp. 2S1]|uniref:hypothetical protein n=1 Tax=Bradyrhizobium sp. 2S1 TaxID=1404429 RepID=UPI0014086E0E|nr:hypothetical protein [Bradyrhizobium sp. 2S1]MCK7666354.1 hypothetical protein [Bradyrhizobium sp. 2S1]
MIEERFDSHTLAIMNFALDRVCAEARHGEGTTLSELTEAGQQALTKVTAAAE